jgi:hypothetical protein
MRGVEGESFAVEAFKGPAGDDVVDIVYFSAGLASGACLTSAFGFVGSFEAVAGPENFA